MWTIIVTIRLNIPSRRQKCPCNHYWEMKFIFPGLLPYDSSDKANKLGEREILTHMWHDYLLLNNSFPRDLLFQILKDDAVKVLHSICQEIWKIQQWPQDWKTSVFSSIPKKGNAKECSNYHTNALISHASKVMLKILWARLQQYVNRELPDVQAGFRKGRGTRDQIANICWIIEKAREFQKNIYFFKLTMSKPLTVWITRNCGKFLER